MPCAHLTFLRLGGAFYKGVVINNDKTTRTTTTKTTLLGNDFKEMSSRESVERFRPRRHFSVIERHLVDNGIYKKFNFISVVD